MKPLDRNISVLEHIVSYCQQIEQTMERFGNSADPKLAKLARSSDPQIFTESIFPKAFDTAAQDSYLEAQDTFSSLFEDTSKYKAIMSALAEWLYGEFRKK